MTKYNPDSNLDINIRFPNNNKNDNDHYSNFMATSMSNIISKEEEESKSIQQQNGNNNKSKLLFLGTGSSTGCPKPLCSLLFPLQQQQKKKQQQQQRHPKSSQTNDEDDALKGEDDLRQLRLEMIGKCKVSNMAIHNGTPESNKNYRGNPSLVISHYCDTTKVQKNVIIDVGKTFREHALRWMPRHNITSLDAVVLTHEHMDAMGGLDDLRGFQRILSARHKETPAQRQTIPIYSSSQCLQTVQRTFPYLVPKKKAVAAQPGKTVVQRDVSALTYNVVTHFQSFQPISGTNIQMIPLPVMHGEDLICNGYMIIIPSSSSSISDNNNNTTTKEKSATTTTILYLSDISRMLPETLEYIQTNFSNNTIDFMIVDSLKHHGTHITHFSLEQAKALSNIIQPTQKTYIVGIDCDDFDDHDIFNETKLPKHIQLAHDGLAIPLH